MPLDAPPRPDARTPAGPTRRERLHRLLRTRVLAHRRLLAFGCAAASTAVVVSVLAPAPPESRPVLVAARDLAAGTVVGPEHLDRAAWPVGAAPAGLVTTADAVGRTLAAPLRRGEPVTDLRLTAPGLLAGYPGLVALPVRLPDPAVVALLRVGDRVDVVAADPERGTTEVVARSSVVLALPPEAGAAGDGVTGRLVVLGLQPAELDEVGVAAVRQFLTVAFSH